MRKLRQPFSYRFTTVKALFHKHDQIDQSFLVPWIKQNIYFFKCLIVANQKCWQLFGTAWKLSTRERDGREEQWCNNKRFNHYCDLHEKTYSTWHRGAMCKAKPHHLFHMSACLRSKRNPPPNRSTADSHSDSLLGQVRLNFLLTSSRALGQRLTTTAFTITSLPRIHKEEQEREPLMSWELFIGGF